MVIVADLKKQIKILICIIILLCIFLFFKRYSFHKIEVEQDHAIIHINLLIPMNQEKIKDAFQIEPQVPGTKFACDYKWLGSSRLEIHLKEMENPKGQNITFKIVEGKSEIPLLKKTLAIPIQFEAVPQIIEFSPEEQISTEGPIKVIFNTPIEEGNIDQYIESDMDLVSQPLKVAANDKKYTDYSQWLLYPNKRLKNNTEYYLKFKKGLKAQSGLVMENEMEKVVETVSKPKILEVTPKDKGEWVSFYPKIVVETDEAIEKAGVELEGIEGKIKIRENKIEFLPNELLKPDTEYRLKIQVQSYRGEKSDMLSTSFKTMPMKEDLLWVEVSLKDHHEVMIHEGEKVTRTMKASGGLPEEPTVLGTFYIQDRGPNFFAERFGEGATYWVRIVEQYLFHGIPRNREWEIIESERRKLGGPASHGCVRLSEEDAKWFYENIPHGTMVIIHE